MAAFLPRIGLAGSSPSGHRTGRLANRDVARIASHVVNRTKHRGKRKNAERDTLGVLCKLPGKRSTADTKKAPQVIHLENRCLVDRGAWQIKRLRRGQVVELTPWSSLESLDSTVSGPLPVKRDPLAQARLYQSLLDSGLAKNRADVARYFGVSRARVSQVLNRLQR